mgnify:CR=1 FL=1
MSKAIITISRQYGSGGRLIAQKLSEKLGIPFYDQALIDMAAKESGYEAALFEHVDEHTNNWFYNLSMFGNSTAMQDLPLNDKIFLAQSNVIRKVADQGPCVIVGRCADYALADFDNCISIFVHADMDKRIKRIASKYALTEAKARDQILKTDKKRASYYNYYTENRWGEAKNYDLCLNAALGLDTCADLIVDAAKAMNK